MKISGDEAKFWKAVNLDSYADIATRLESADEETGAVAFFDKTGEKKSVSLGPHRVKLVRKDSRDR